MSPAEPWISKHAINLWTPWECCAGQAPHSSWLLIALTPSFQKCAESYSFRMEDSAQMELQTNYCWITSWAICLRLPYAWLNTRDSDKFCQISNNFYTRKSNQCKQHLKLRYQSSDLIAYKQSHRRNTSNRSSTSLISTWRRQQRDRSSNLSILLITLLSTSHKIETMSTWKRMFCSSIGSLFHRERSQAWPVNSNSSYQSFV